MESRINSRRTQSAADTQKEAFLKSGVTLEGTASDVFSGYLF